MSDAYCLRCGAPHNGDCLRDLPLIRCRPTPSDTELAAERDAQHALEVARWITGDECQCPQWPVICHCAWPVVGEVLG